MNNTQNNKLTPRGFIKTISILHLALLGGQVFFLIFAYTQNSNTKINFIDANNIYIYIIPVIIIVGFLTSNFVYKQFLGSILKKTSLKEKLTTFQTALLIKYALIEGPTFLVIFAYMNFGNLLYLIIALVLIVYFYLLKPSKEKIKNELNLNNEHKSKFNKLDEIID